jgi:hypothetical protein
MAEKVYPDDRKGHLGTEKGPAEGVAAKVQLLLLFAPAAEYGAAGADEVGTGRRGGGGEGNDAEGGA